MDIRFNPQELAFREEVRHFLANDYPADIRHKVSRGLQLDRADHVRWQQLLAARGWAGVNWPVEYGGTGWSPVQKYIFSTECAIAHTPRIVPFGLGMVGPVICTFGNEEQKARFLPDILASRVWWCQGYSEPNSGSDLASLQTRAVRDGDHYVVNGQKTWTTLGQYGDWIFCLVRTDSGTSKRQEGISFLLIDMNTPGITVRPLILLDEGHEVNEVFFDEVRVPVENLVHEENQGWTVAKYLLGHERLNTGRIGQSRRELLRLRELAARTLVRGQPLLDDVRFRDRLSRVEIELMALEITNMRFLDDMRRNGKIGPEVSMLKIRGTEIQQAITELMMQAVGPRAQAFKPIRYDGFDDFMASSASRYFNFRKTSIYAGSNEIQRNIFAKMALGL